MASKPWIVRRAVLNDRKPRATSRVVRSRFRLKALESKAEGPRSLGRGGYAGALLARPKRPGRALPNTSGRAVLRFHKGDLREGNRAVYANSAASREWARSFS